MSVRLNLSYVCVKSALSAIFVQMCRKGVWFCISILFTIRQNWKTFIWNYVRWTLWRSPSNLAAVCRTQSQFEDITLGRKFLRCKITRCSKQYLFFSFENHFTVCSYSQAVPPSHQNIAFQSRTFQSLCKNKIQDRKIYPSSSLYTQYIFLIYLSFI